ncbi:sialate O-acetylesterase [Hungatella effluvii]|nr:sialate O-acetylesterase [Hungatella effluvii]
MMEADILLFMGQSNMAGRGDDQLAPKVLPGNTGR